MECVLLQAKPMPGSAVPDSCGNPTFTPQNRGSGPRRLPAKQATDASFRPIGAHLLLCMCTSNDDLPTKVPAPIPEIASTHLLARKKAVHARRASCRIMQFCL